MCLKACPRCGNFLTFPTLATRSVKSQMPTRAALGLRSPWILIFGRDCRVCRAMPARPQCMLTKQCGRGQRSTALEKFLRVSWFERFKTMPSDFCSLITSTPKFRHPRPAGCFPDVPAPSLVVPKIPKPAAASATKRKISKIMECVPRQRHYQASKLRKT